MKTSTRRLIHFAKVAAGDTMTRLLKALSRRGRGPSQRIRRVGQFAARHVEFRTVVPAVPLSTLAPLYYARGETERKYLDMMADVGDGMTPPPGIISASDIDVSLPIGMHRWRGRVFEEALLGVEVLTNPKYALDLETIPYRPKARHGEAVLLTMPWHHNFYHWMIEILPRVMLIDRADDLKHLKLIVPNNAPSFIRDSLTLAGCDHRVTFLDKGVHRFERLHIPSRLALTADVSPFAIDWLNRRMPAGPLSGNRRIYISRADARNRFVANEAEVESVLRDFGFETVVLSNLGLHQQMNLFREAEFVVGSHGAGFAHLAFARPGTRFIEFFEEGHFNRCFHQIAGVRGLDYGFLVGKRRGFGFDVDTRQLRDVMGQASGRNTAHGQW